MSYISIDDQVLLFELPPKDDNLQLPETKTSFCYQAYVIMHIIDREIQKF